MTNKIKIGLTLIPMQLILMYISIVILLRYTTNPVILQIGNFLPTVLVFIMALFLFKDRLINDWKRLDIAKWKLIVISIIGVIVIQVIFNIINMLSVASDNNLDAIYIPFSELSALDKSLFIFFSLASVLSGLTEELYFRYLFLKKIFVKHKFIGLVASSVLFGLAHYFVEYSFESTIGYMIVGLVFGFIYLKTDNIWYTASIHMLNNFCFSILVVFI
ncbi:CPBP family intramembrane metalloprotease [Listeria seeligeri]|uniref:CPBP family intramembrane glutamic endopeptidase n=1 Tax=Listeria seeligeri TaxID=1640 RepID=UPI001119376C|nr:type II CAAX endopeptidase family protein [Listeria seeligeri]EAG6328047.1 CPBP family intramembrane metalloprotease [Listeria monocytogenes]QDA74655.1 CPBP family intramembrane metalloprotease [Listeria seeligeri]